VHGTRSEPELGEEPAVLAALELLLEKPLRCLRGDNSSSSSSETVMMRRNGGGDPGVKQELRMVYDVEVARLPQTLLEDVKCSVKQYYLPGVCRPHLQNRPEAEAFPKS
jgi:hypothetical protein